MEAPQQIQPRSLADYLEVMSKAVFQTGISWRVVDAKWPGTREAFRRFDPSAVAALTPDELDALAGDTRLIRNRRKIEAVVDNARQMLELEQRHGSFRDYLRSHGGFEETVADLRKRFKFVGDLGAYHFLWVVSEPVPSYEDWCASRGRTPHPVAH
ncbi:MAG TPA: DNA-3-methyladenine glycosylase I [Dehalococcoidia bacterium]|nr:DNA-3-methyladenine glycosylase I [Dehalococcoidia bacterium]